MEIQARRFGDKFLPGQLKVLWFISAIITELFIFLNLKQVSHFYVEFGTTNISSLNFSSNSCSHQPSLKKKCIEMILLIRQENCSTEHFYFGTVVL